ncbi:MAG: DUF1540 domain-containing protein [Angelakisella sp.]|nr:DUF1540 domain-containing protein [Angelakisella sp.]
MNALQCTAVDCANNSSGCCCRPDIKVSGNNACNCAGTRCSSFEERKEGIYNSTGFVDPNHALDIRCSVGNCTYNCHGKCDANDVCIDCTSGGTQCSSFVPQ